MVQSAEIKRLRDEVERLGKKCEVATRALEAIMRACEIDASRDMDEQVNELWKRLRLVRLK